MFLFLDPGVTTGYALFDDKGTPKDYGQITGVDNLLSAFTMLHSKTPLEKIFHEPYVLRNSATQNMNHNQKKGHQDTLRCIGKIEAFGELNNIPVEEIRYITLNAALAQAGLRMPSNHAESHQIVALAYGQAYYIKHGIKKVRRRPL